MRLIWLLIPLGLIVLAATGCVSSPPIAARRTACSALVPSHWKSGVEGAALPAESVDPLAALKAWISFGIEQTGQLDKSNGRTSDALAIIERCETRDAAAIDAAGKRWWQVWR